MSSGAPERETGPLSGAGIAVEGLARAGIAIAAGAVGTGARLTGRALGALRGVVERR
jgi:hypothetical protein